MASKLPFDIAPGYQAGRPVQEEEKPRRSQLLYNGLLAFLTIFAIIGFGMWALPFALPGIIH